MNARRASQAGAGVAVAVAALLLTVAPGAAISPATAADSGLLLSADGASWFTSLNGNVFSARGALVPGDALPGSFYVMNNRDTPAYLRVGLSDLAVSDASLASALTLTAVATTASDASGSTVGFAAPDAVCTDFLRRTGPLPPHGVALVSADLRFKQSTPGRSAQGELARIGFVVELADIDLNATNTPLCDGVLEVVPPGELDPGAGPGDPGLGGDGVPATPGGGAGGGSGGSGAGGGTGSATGSGSGGSAAGADAGAGGLPAEFAAPSTGSASGIVAFGPGGEPILPSYANTVRWWEEYAVLIAIGAALAGLLARLAAERSRQRHDQGGMA